MEMLATIFPALCYLFQQVPFITLKWTLFFVLIHNFAGFMTVSEQFHKQNRYKLLCIEHEHFVLFQIYLFLSVDQFKFTGSIYEESAALNLNILKIGQKCYLKLYPYTKYSFNLSWKIKYI